MSVIACPVCQCKVNSGARRCPECGADVHLGADEARAELLAQETARGPSPPSAPSIPSKLRRGWRWRYRLLAAVPALIGAVWLIVTAARARAHEAALRQSLDPAFDEAIATLPDFDMFLAECAVLVGVMVVVLALLVALPRRLWEWWGVLAPVLAFLVGGGPVVMAVAVVEGYAGTSVFATITLLCYLYIPLLAIVRLIWQGRVDTKDQLPAQPVEAQV